MFPGVCKCSSWGVRGRSESKRRRHIRCVLTCVLSFIFWCRTRIVTYNCLWFCCIINEELCIFILSWGLKHLIARRGNNLIYPAVHLPALGGHMGKGNMGTLIFQCPCCPVWWVLALHRFRDQNCRDECSGFMQLSDWWNFTFACMCGILPL